MPKKTCRKCERRKPLTAFHRHTASVDGFNNACKKCCRVVRLARAVAENARKRQYRKENAAAIKAGRRRNYNPDVARARNARYRKSAAGKARCQSLTRAWKEKNRDAVLLHNANRRARLLSADGRVTRTEWANRCIEYGGRCAYCRKTRKLTQHHVIPLSRGGSNWIENVVPACQSCNSRIGTNIVQPEAL